MSALPLRQIGGTRHIYEVLPDDGELYDAEVKDQIASRNKRPCREWTTDDVIMSPYPGVLSQQTAIRKSQQEAQLARHPSSSLVTEASFVADDVVLQQFENEITEERNMLLRAKELKLKLGTKRAEVLSLEAELKEVGTFREGHHGQGFMCERLSSMSPARQHDVMSKKDLLLRCAADAMERMVLHMAFMASGVDQKVRSE